jgi:hypothetical protein
MVGQGNELSLDLAFGDPAHRRRALARLAALPDGVFQEYSSLDHPRFWSVGVDAMDAKPLPANTAGVLLAGNRVHFTIGLGRVHTALELLQEETFIRPMRVAFLYRMHRMGLPLPPGALGETYTLPPDDTSTSLLATQIRDFFGGAWAAEHRRWNDHRIAIARLRGLSARRLATSDSADARFIAGAATALEGFGLARRGDTVRGHQLMSAGQRLTTWGASASRADMNETIRWWLGDLLEGMNQPEEALRYFESLPREVPAFERRARIYERMGDMAKAREAYGLVALAWAGADPEMRPRAEAADSAARRLGGGTRRLGGSAAASRR